MSRKFQIKRGLRVNLPTLAQGELAMTTDTGSEGVHIGTGTGSNIELARKSDIKTPPTKLSELSNDAGYITGYTETDPTVPNWAKQPSKPSYTAGEVGADAVGTASNVVGTHNTSTGAHNDIRLLIGALDSRLTALANSDDETLDQMSEIVGYIKSNRGLIESVTTGKVSVSDIINNLTTNTTGKPLSAAQGVVLKGLIDDATSAIGDVGSILDSINGEVV